MPVQELSEGDGLGRLQLEAIHKVSREGGPPSCPKAKAKPRPDSLSPFPWKVRFSPNLDCHSWLVSGGQSGLVRLHCLAALASSPSRKLLLDCQARFVAVADGSRAADPLASGLRTAIS